MYKIHLGNEFFYSKQDIRQTLNQLITTAQLLGYSIEFNKTVNIFNDDAFIYRLTLFKPSNEITISFWIELKLKQLIFISYQSYIQASFSINNEKTDQIKILNEVIEIL